MTSVITPTVAGLVSVSRRASRFTTRCCPALLGLLSMQLGCAGGGEEAPAPDDRAATGATVAPEATTGALRIQMRAGDSPGKIVCRLTNETDHDVSIVEQNSPLDELHERFEVLKDGERMPYRGKLGTHIGEPLTRTLHASESIEVPVDLADEYRLEPGQRYEVRAVISPLAPISNDPVVAEPLTLQLDDAPIGEASAAIQFTGICSSTDQSVLRQYEEWLYLYVVDAEYQYGDGPTGQRRDWWFNIQTWDQMFSVFYYLGEMIHILETEEFTYDCVDGNVGSCSSGTANAWVRAGHVDSTIHLCPRFWNNDNQVRLRTLAHETSHFAGTSDHPGGAGLTAARNLAINDPAKAVSNAWNYGAFVMNPTGLAD